METIQPRWIAGFWRRIGALLIDSLLLGFVGFLLGSLLESTFVEMGRWGRIVGFLVSLGYFGLMNSSLFNGQTLGKRLLKIRVVDEANNTINLGRSLIRYVVLGTPFFLNALQFSTETVPSLLLYPIYIAVFGGLLAIPYLYLFNTVSRQSLHDLIVGSYVVSTQVEKQDVGPIWKGHPYVIALLLMIATSVPFVAGKLQSDEVFKNVVSNEQLQSATQRITNHPAVKEAYVRVVGFTGFDDDGDAERSSFMMAGVFLRNNDVDNEALAKEFAQAVSATSSEDDENNQVRLMMSYGYDIGIFSRWHHRQYLFNADDLE